ncbi:Bin3-type SAM domain-containing protein [Mycena kentingensis (nom. inval.)]|nr:Bin3-type SAM domain-containing protein [Mycena kentingensis (nom. inval.)]
MSMSGSDTDTSLNTRIASIDTTAGWIPVVNVLWRHFNLPDTTKASGFKKIHANFEALYRKIAKAYTDATDERIKGGIVGIYARFCVDSLLRNKLFKKGFLNQLVPLIELPSCRTAALQALSTITHHGGPEVRAEIAKTCSQALLTVLNDLPADSQTVELAIVTLEHCMHPILADDATPACQRIKGSLPLLETVKVLTEVLRRRAADYNLVSHAIGYIALTAHHVKLPETTLKLFVAGLRSKDWVFRGTCLGALVRIHREGAEDDVRHIDPHALLRCASNPAPPKLNDILMDYGFDKTELYTHLKTQGVYMKAMMGSVSNRDLYALGKVLANIILTTEFSIGDGAFEYENEVTGQRELMTQSMTGLPFSRWGDALPHCARAIREKGVPAEADLADILDLKFFVMRQRFPDGVKLANAAIKRNPDFFYAYYFMTLTADRVAGLCAAKKGMKCPGLTPFVRFQMMQRAVEMAGDYGIQILQQRAAEGDEKWAEGIAFLMSALEDSKSYIAQAPPDNRHHKNVLYWNILLRITMDEHISGDLHEIEGSIRKLKTADEFSTWMGIRPPRTEFRQTQETVVKRLSGALAEWSATIATIRSDSVAETPSAQKREEDLAAWMENMELDGCAEAGCGHDHHHHRGHHRGPARKAPLSVPFSVKRAELYRCSWCGNPSAALRKCAGCSQTRYCDATCQKQHWKKQHKQQCKPKE